jgi:hypothetical protein
MTGAADPFAWLMSQNTPEEREVSAQNEEAMRDARNAAREEAQLFADVFQHGRGPELLELLRDRTIEVPLMDVSRSIVRGEVALSPAEWAYVREGQNSVIRHIQDQIRIALTPEEDPQPAATTEGEGNA